MAKTTNQVQLLTTAEAARLLGVSQRTILNWIKADAVRYVELPSSGDRPNYRIPLGDLLAAVGGTYDLAAALDELEESDEVRT